MGRNSHQVLVWQIHGCNHDIPILADVSETIGANFVPLHNFIFSRIDLLNYVQVLYITQLVLIDFLVMYFLVMLESIQCRHRITSHSCFRINLPGYEIDFHITDLASNQ